MIHWVAYHEGMLFQPRDVVAEFMKMVDVVMDDFYQRTPVHPYMLSFQRRCRATCVPSPSPYYLYLLYIFDACSGVMGRRPPRVRITELRPGITSRDHGRCLPPASWQVRPGKPVYVARKYMYVGLLSLSPDARVNSLHDTHLRCVPPPVGVDGREPFGDRGAVCIALPHRRP